MSDNGKKSKNIKGVPADFTKCIHCGRSTSESDYYFHQSLNRYKQPCKTCQKERAKRLRPEWTKRDRERRRTDKKYRDRINEYNKRRSKEYIVKKRKRVSLWKKKQRDQISNYYAKEQLKKAHGIRNAPQELIELKKLNLQLIRAAKSNGQT